MIDRAQGSAARRSVPLRYALITTREAEGAAEGLVHKGGRLLAQKLMHQQPRRHARRSGGLDAMTPPTAQQLGRLRHGNAPSPNFVMDFDMVCKGGLCIRACWLGDDRHHNEWCVSRSLS